MRVNATVESYFCIEDLSLLDLKKVQIIFWRTKCYWNVSFPFVSDVSNSVGFNCDQVPNKQILTTTMKNTYCLNALGKISALSYANFHTSLEGISPSKDMIILYSLFVVLCHAVNAA